MGGTSGKSKDGKGGKGGKGKKGGGCPAGEAPILLTQPLYDVVKKAVDSAKVQKTNRLICLNTTAAQLLLQATAIGLGLSGSKKKKKGRKGKKGGK